MVNVMALDVYCVGLGSQFSGHLREKLEQDSVVVKGLCDTDESKLLQARTVIDAPTTQDFDELLAWAGQPSHSTRLFVISTPPATHCELVLKCLESGAHVYVDKPPALTFQEVRALAKASDDAELDVGVGAQRRLEDVYVALAARLDDIGEVRRMHLHAHGNFESMSPDIPDRNILPEGMGYHVVDTAVWLLQKAGLDPSRVELVGAALHRNRQSDGKYEGFEATFHGPGYSTGHEYTVHLAASGLAPKRAIDEGLTIHGSLGELELRRVARPRDAVPGEVRLVRWRDETESHDIIRLDEPHHKGDRGAPLASLIARLTTKRVLPTPLLGDLLSTHRVIDMILERAVRVP